MSTSTLSWCLRGVSFQSLPCLLILFLDSLFPPSLLWTYSDWGDESDAQNQAQCNSHHQVYILLCEPKHILRLPNIFFSKILELSNPDICE